MNDAGLHYSCRPIPGKVMSSILPKRMKSAVDKIFRTTNIQGLRKRYSVVMKLYSSANHSKSLITI